jgi:single-strand DNA-binding protein
MIGVNKVILLGNLGKDPEVRYLEGGIAVAKFSLATTESYKNKEGQKVEQTEWHNVVLWRGLAELAEKALHKGSTVYVEGKIRTRSWVDKEGVKKYMTEIMGDNISILTRKSDAPASTNHDAAHAPEPPIAEPSSSPAVDDLPF